MAMESDAVGLVRTPPAGLLWAESSPVDATFRWKRSWLVAHLAGMVWNGGFVMMGLVGSHPKWPPVVPALAGVGVLLFALLFLRALVATTKVHFNATEFTVRTDPLGGSPLKLALQEIVRFVARPNEDENRTELVVALASGAEIAVPLDFEPPTFVVRGSKRRVWSAPPEHAAYVASRLEAMLEVARRMGHDSYRA